MSRMVMLRWHWVLLLHGQSGCGDVVVVVVMPCVPHDPKTADVTLHLLVFLLAAATFPNKASRSSRLKRR